MEEFDSSRPYLYISCNGEDKELVHPLIGELKKDGYRLWYETGLMDATAYVDTIQTAIDGSHVFLLLLSESALKNHRIDNELSYARSKKKAVFTVFLEPIELPASMKMMLCGLQTLSFYRFGSLDSFLETLHQSELLKPCREDPRLLMRDELSRSFLHKTPFYRIRENTSPVEIPAVNLTVPPHPTVMIGIGGIGTKTVNAVYRDLPEANRTMLSTLAVNDDPTELDGSEIPTLLIPRIDSPREERAAFDRLGTKAKETLFSEEELEGLRLGDTLRLSAKKRAYLAFHQAELSGELSLLDEMIARIGQNCKIILVTTPIGNFGTAVLLPLAQYLSARCQASGITPYIQVFLPSPDILPDTFASYTTYDTMLASSHALLKELVHASDGNQHNGTLINEIKTVPMPRENETLSKNLITFRDTLAAELILPIFPQSPAISALSVKKIRLPKRQVLVSAVTEHANRLTSFPFYHTIKSLLSADEKLHPITDRCWDDAVKKAILNSPHAGEYLFTPDSVLPFLELLEEDFAKSTLTFEEERELCETLTFPEPKKPKLFASQSEKERLADDFQNTLKIAKKAIDTYWEKDLLCEDAILSHAEIRERINAYFSPDDREALTLLGIMENGRFLSPTVALTRFSLLRDAVRDRCQGLTLTEPDNRMRFSLPESPIVTDEAYRRAIQKSHYYRCGDLRFLIACDPFATVYYDLTVLRNDCERLAKIQIDLRRAFRKTRVLCRMYHALEEKLDTLIGQYTKYLENSTEKPFSTPVDRYPQHSGIVSFNEAPYRPMPDQDTEDLVNDLLGKAFYTNRFHPSEHYAAVYRILWDALRASPAITALINRSIATTLCKSENGIDPERFKAMLAALPCGEGHRLFALILPPTESSFFEEHQSNVLPPIEPYHKITRDLDGYCESILLIYRTPFYRPDTYSPESFYGKFAFRAYERLRTDLQRTPHVYAANTKPSVLPEIPRERAKAYGEEAAGALLAAVLSKEASFEARGEIVLLTRYRQGEIETQVPDTARAEFTDSYLQRLYDAPDRIKRHLLFVSSNVMKERKALPIPNSEEDIPRLVDAILSMPTVKALYTRLSGSVERPLSLVSLALRLQRADIPSFRSLYTAKGFLKMGLMLLHKIVEDALPHRVNAFSNREVLIDRVFALLIAELSLTAREEKSLSFMRSYDLAKFIKTVAYPQ